MALTLTALTDVIELPEVSALHEQGDYQTFGYWPAIGKVMADVGFFGYVNLTDFDATAVQWDPGNNATDGVVLATAPAKRRWYLEGTGPDLVLVGWTDEVVTDPAPFVIEMPVSRLAPDGGVVVTAGEVELVSHTPVVIAPDGEGMVVAAGEAELVAHLPVEVTPDGPGEVVTAGEVRLTVAGHIAPEDPGSVVTAGELVSGGLVAQVYPDGLGGLVELALTQGTWPGAARAGTVPKTFDRMNNRRYGGDIGGARPPWWTPIDEGNALAEYVAFWSWCVEDPDNAAAVRDASAVSGNGTIINIPNNYDLVVTGAPVPGANQAYAVDRYLDPEYWIDEYTSADGNYRIKQHGVYPWALLDDEDVVIDFSSGGYVWDPLWYYGTNVAKGGLVSKWRSTGLEAHTYMWNGTNNGVSLPLPVWQGEWTIVCDCTICTANLDTFIAAQAVVNPLSVSESMKVYLVHGEGGGGAGAIGVKIAHGSNWGQANFTTPLTLGERSRIIISKSTTELVPYISSEEGATGDVTGLEFTSGCHSPASQAFLFYDAIGTSGNGLFWGIVHEFGFLNGYAATAADVANNAMFAIPYGARGSMLPVTDAPVA